MSGHIVWLEGRVDDAELGARAAALASLRGAGVAVPRAFCLGRRVHHRLTSMGDDRWLDTGKLPPDLHREVAAAIQTLGGSFAVRRSPLDASREPGQSQGGRPERETYLHLTDVAEAVEAVRRVWGPGGSAPSRSRVAIMVQRFLLPDACALVRSDGDRELLQVQSSLGVGDLLAAGLVVPDRHTIRRSDGTIVTATLGRKAQMTIPRDGGGLARVPVPASAARRLVLDENKLCQLADTFRRSEEVLGPLQMMMAAWSGGRWHVMSVEPTSAPAEDGLLLG